MEITQNKLEQMLLTAASMGANEVISRLNLDKKQISMREAYKSYGRKRVDSWIRDGLVSRVKQGARVYVNKAEIEKQASIDKLTERICHE